MNIRRLINIGCAISAIGLGVGLASCSSVGQREGTNPSAYNSLGSSQQQLASQGKISTGMSKDAVRIALGTPVKTSINRDIECWQYERTKAIVMPEHQEAPHYTSYIGNDLGYNEQQQFLVFFKNDKVVSWK